MEFTLFTSSGTAQFYQPTDATERTLAATAGKPVVLFKVREECELPVAAAGKALLGLALSNNDDQVATLTDGGQVRAAGVDGNQS